MVKALQKFVAQFPLAVLVLGVLVSCGTPPPAPVVERGQPPSIKIKHHIVSRDESLYAIAWRYELDFRRLAEVNGLSSPFPLYPGQKLSLDMSKAPPRTVVNRSAESSAITAHPIPPAAKPQAEPPPKMAMPKAPPLPGGGWKWQWPARGKVTREYDASRVLKGISIYTTTGESVVAAAPGVVVYAGEGLRGYGRLIIVKHSNTHLSAYAHNHRILVQENDAVKQGQKIAEVGKDTANRPRLYFEIRENGKPVDPLTRLPK